MNFYEQIFSRGRATGEGMTHFERLFAAKFGGSPPPEVREYTGAVPVTITADGTPLIDYLISGNMIQSGTPTPDSPVMPQGTGERTEQLFDENYPNIKVDTPTYRSIYVGDGTFTLSTTTVQYRDSANLFFLAGNVGSGASTQNNGVWNGNPRTVTAVDGYVTIAYRYYTSGETSDPRSNDVMLNSGSTAIPYEPYGYKLDISSGGENLWDEEYTNISSTAVYRPLFVGDGTFTLSTNFQLFNSATDIFLLPGIASSGINSSTNGAYDGKSITATSVGGYVTIAYRKYARPSSGAITECKTMLNLGSTALPYSPYNRTTTPIYFGEAETTRQVKKLVFDGSESWNRSTSGNNTRVYTPQIPECLSLSPAICTHFNYNVANVGYPRVGEFVINSSKAIIFGVDATEFTTVDEWKAYLAAQYAAGTPVCVWYVLSTETTGIVNEPLMRIGDYADTLSKEQAGVSIPTNNGSTTVDVDTTVKPSEVYIKYMG